MINPLISMFVVERNKLTSEDIKKLQLFCKSSENTEKWEIEVNEKSGLVNGFCFGSDLGIFYLFLIENRLDKIIDIIRG